MSYRVAKRYAQALYSLAQERGKLLSIKEDLEQVERLLEESAELRRLLYHQLIPPSQKIKLISEVFAVSEDTRKFLALVVEKRRERWLPEIVRQFKQLVDEAQGIVEAEVTAAYPLPEEIKEEIQGKLSSLLGKNVRLRERLDQNIIGGLLVRIGDRILDASLRRRLEIIKENLRRVELKL